MTLSSAAQASPSQHDSTEYRGDVVTPVVDIHSHTFNGDDLPVAGFIRHVHLRGVPLGQTLAALADALVQGLAPGYVEEKAKLDALLGDSELETIYGLETRPSPPEVSPAFESDVDAALEEVRGRDPRTLTTIAAQLRAVEGGSPEEFVYEGLGDSIRTARRAFRWVKLYGRSRLDLTRLLIENFNDQIDLYCPLLVDLGSALGDAPVARMREQMELHEKISRLSMQGKLPGVTRGRVHPFIGFDPRSQVRSEAAGDIDTPFEVVRAAVMDYGFVGVKLYPPMGWKPLNQSTDAMTPEEGKRVDKALRTFYAWCQAEDVPLTAHCNESNFANERWRFFAHPDNWAEALKEFPQLRVNLGHFGGANIEESLDGWPFKAATVASRHSHVFVDVGNHKVYDTDLADAYIRRLKQIFSTPATSVMNERIMFGSDWYMVALHPDHNQFLDNYREAYGRFFDKDETEAFLGGNAIRFLGFDKATNANRLRLLARYERYAADRIPGWLTASD